MREAAVPAFFGMTWRDTHPDDVEREVALRLSHDRLGYELAVKAVVDRRPVDLLRLAELDLPVVVITGEHDKLTPLDNATELVAAIPGAELVVIHDAGHHTPIEQPAAVTAAIGALLARIDWTRQASSGFRATERVAWHRTCTTVVEITTVELMRLELTTSCMPCKRSSQLSYSPVEPSTLPSGFGGSEPRQ